MLVRPMKAAFPSFATTGKSTELYRPSGPGDSRVVFDTRMLLVPEPVGHVRITFPKRLVLETVS